MAVAKPVTAHELGRVYAEAVGDEPAARRLWVNARRDEFELWLLADPRDDEAELRLYGADLVLIDRFPETPVTLHVIVPDRFEHFDLEEIVPSGAEELPLRPR